MLRTEPKKGEPADLSLQRETAGNAVLRKLDFNGRWIALKHRSNGAIVTEAIRGTHASGCVPSSPATSGSVARSLASRSPTQP